LTCSISNTIIEKSFYFIFKLPVENAEDFIIWMLEDFELDGETIMIAPAEGFYATPGLGMNEARIAYVLDEVQMKRAMFILEKGLEAYQKRNN
jgi:aspartate aminotransferase